ncbi:MAG: ABC transporter ATP-binding protein [Eubacteriales bacterium]|nr:ABC transporter ATP-binding protein [Eubacteriales bacterium]
MSLLECKDLTFRYGRKLALSNQNLALSNLNLDLETGQIVGLLGPNGSGKTTLIKLIEGLLTPTSGQVLVDGKKPGPETKAMVAYLPDRNFLPLYFTVGQVFDLYEDFFADFDRKKAKSMEEELGITDNTRLKSMSKGTLEKLHLVVTMSRRAKIYLLDEPIAGVDPAARDYIIRTIIGGYSPDSLVIISTHLIADIENVLDDVIFINKGEVTLHGKADELREKRGLSIDDQFREAFRC